MIAEIVHVVGERVDRVTLLEATWMVANDLKDCETQHGERLHQKLSTTPFAALTIAVEGARCVRKLLDHSLRCTSGPGHGQLTSSVAT